MPNAPGGAVERAPFGYTDCSGALFTAWRSQMIVLGVILLIIGFVAKVPILWTLGIIVLLIGAVLAIAGVMGREIGGRRHWY